ncbi:MAG: cytochrome c oxidase subunit 3 [Sphingomonadales bacterium]|nr:cytochrome c oxidase subunit 3 [Sphingomonadales bacterium]
MTARENPDHLPGDLMMWVLIISELLVFGAGLTAFLGVRISDPAGFAEGRHALHGFAAGINTMLLVTSGWMAALSVRAQEEDAPRTCRMRLGVAATLGAGFLAVKGWEYASLSALGHGLDDTAFFTFYFLLTGFHAAHVAAGIVILGLVGWKLSLRNAETGVAFWHMVDLVWVLLFPVIYLLP